MVTSEHGSRRRRSVPICMRGVQGQSGLLLTKTAVTSWWIWVYLPALPMPSPCPEVVLWHLWKYRKPCKMEVSSPHTCFTCHSLLNPAERFPSEPSSCPLLAANESLPEPSDFLWKPKKAELRIVFSDLPMVGYNLSVTNCNSSAIPM